MKNAIRILLYLLLALLVVAIAVIIYKRSKAPVDDVPTTSEMADSLFMDQNQGNQTALNSEDSMILDLTGQLPSQVGAPAKSTDTKSPDTKAAGNKSTDAKSTENKQTNPVNKSATINNTIDYSQPIGPTEPTAAVNTNPKAQKVSDHSTKTMQAAEVKPPAVNKPEIKKSETKSTTSKSLAKTVASKSTTYYVVSGSFIVPDHADEQVKKLKKLGYKKASRKVFGSSEYYCAVTGKYNNRNEAEKIVHKLKAKGEPAFLKVK